jgi:hypothetical protein
MKLMEYVPTAVVVPLSVAVPLPAVKTSPLGKVPDSVIPGVGRPVAVTVKEPFTPDPKVALLALVNAGI